MFHKIQKYMRFHNHKHQLLYPLQLAIYLLENVRCCFPLTQVITQRSMNHLVRDLTFSLLLLPQELYIREMKQLFL
jgi:hypothetical protein